MTTHSSQYSRKAIILFFFCLNARSYVASHVMRLFNVTRFHSASSLAFLSTTKQRWRKNKNFSFSTSLKLFLCTNKFKELERDFFFHFGNEFYLIDWLLNYWRMTRWKNYGEKEENCFRSLNNLDRVGFSWVLQFTGSFIHWASHSETYREAHLTWTWNILGHLDRFLLI